MCLTKDCHPTPGSNSHLNLGTSGCCDDAAVLSFLGLLFPPGLGWNHTGGITNKCAGDRESLWLQIHLSLEQRPGTGLDCSLTSGVLCYSQSKAVREIWHYQYLSWPDHGVPSEPGGVLSFLDQINQKQESIPNAGPILVHCRLVQRLEFEASSIPYRG